MLNDQRVQHNDVCIVCALPEEAKAFIWGIQSLFGDVIENRISSRYHYPYRFAVIKNRDDRPLNLYISWPPRYGPQEITLHLIQVLEEFQPRIAIMTGICAGDAKHVRLGDLVVAERTFSNENGKFIRDDHGIRVHQLDNTTYQLEPAIKQFVELFDGWKPLVARLEKPASAVGVQEVTCHVKAMASGSVVRADNPFEEVQAPVRNTIAIDMESAAFAMVVSRKSKIPWFIVKGVCDYADARKNDLYHEYAARVSALYALSFIQEYVTEGHLPLQNVQANQDRTPDIFVNPVGRNPRFTSFVGRRKNFLLIFLLLLILGSSSLYYYVFYTDKTQQVSSYGPGSSQGQGSASAKLNPIWTSQNSGTTQVLGSITASPSLFVVVGGPAGPFPGQGIILTSKDGKTWTIQRSDVVQTLNTVAWSDTLSLFAAVGEKGVILTSPDGKYWTSEVSHTERALYDVAWSRRLFVAVGEKGIILTSPDGKTWTPQVSPTTQDLFGNSGSNHLYVVVGALGTLLTSPDGKTWTLQNGVTGHELNNVIWTGSQFIVIGGDTHQAGTVFTSRDGSAWTAISNLSGSQYIDAAWSGLQVVAVGAKGTIVSSRDGSKWTMPQQSGTLQTLYGVIWSHSKFVAVGGGGTILTSP